MSDIWEPVFPATDGSDVLYSLLDNNPLECDCGITPSLWTAEVTGTCAHPPHLRGVEVNTLYNEDFTCGWSDFYLYFKLSKLRIMEQSENEMTGASA